MACRDVAKAETTLKEITEESGNQNVVIRKLDLSDTKSIKEFAEVINRGKLTLGSGCYVEYTIFFGHKNVTIAHLKYITNTQTL